MARRPSWKKGMNTINSNDFTAFKSAICRIFNSQGKVVGGGVLVSNQYVVTCAHVITQALGIPQETLAPPTGLIDVDFPLVEAEHKLKASVDFWQPVSAVVEPPAKVDDIAILKLENELSQKVQPVRLVSAEDFWEHSFRIFGFPSGHDDGVWATGILCDKTTHGWIQMVDVTVAGYKVEPGFSGVPIWDKKLAGVVGIAVAAEKKREDVKAAFMIPTVLLRDVIPGNFISLPAKPISSPTVDERYQPIISAFTSGKIVPFLGAGINLCDCPEVSPLELALQLAQKYYPSKGLLGIPCSVCPLPPQSWPPPEKCPVWEQVSQGSEKDVLTCPLSNEQRLVLAKMNLRFLSQYMRFLHESDDDLYTQLHAIWDSPYKKILEDNHSPRRLHEFFATLPKTMLKRGYRDFPYPLIVTTNCDEMLERAFQEAHQEFDVIFYVAEDKGKFMHKTWEGKVNSIPYDSDYQLPFGKRPIILKLYGTWNDKFVITEDHHMNYLVGCSVEQALPSKLVNLLRDSRILFLGYSLNDLDLQMILHRFWGDQPLKQFRGMKSWIVHNSEPGRLEEEFCKDRQVEPIKSSLEDFITNLEVGIEQLNSTIA
jgi:SIR2-like domain/Trypsin-like peptidase domain